ncbi:uncharacterized protein LOC123654461 [Melitaea cinxia]|uniref:uncharacterized protein LOC123654461 n=1 Tax=Melitaea cinxia TaxID=113334 RepID=UPI001E2736AE|nr:uncharacterized protein LOC123654461 [Melitaea cinxia]
MGSLNIAEWTPDQVAEWMSGLGPKVAQYVPELHKQGLNGAKLLTLRCDDLEYLGIHIIGHQELLLEAIEHLRNFHYEISRECVQQLALRVSSAASSLARALRHHMDARLETQSLADVARTVHAVKPLVCWLDSWPLCSGSPLAERKTALLKLSLEAATCAQRDRFAEQPARAVAAAAAAVAAVADYIIQDVSDPTILQPASLDAVSLRQGERALGFEVLRSLCGHHQLAHLRFASPAHASGLVHEADEIVQVGGKCVIGWSGEAVERACADAARGAGELQLRLRRRGARALPAAPLRPHLALHSCGCGGAAPARRPPRRCGRTWRCTGDTRHVPLSHTLSAAAAPGAAQVTRDTCPLTHTLSCGCGGAAPARCPPRRCGRTWRCTGDTRHVPLSHTLSAAAAPGAAQVTRDTCPLTHTLSCGRTWRCTGDTRHVPSHTHSQLRLRRRGARALPAAPLRPHLALHSCGRTWRCTGDTRHVPSHTHSQLRLRRRRARALPAAPLRPHLALHSCGRTWRCTGDTRHVPSHTHSQLRLRRRGARALPAAPLRPHLALHSCGRTWRCTGDTRHVPSHTHSQLRLRRRGARALPAAPLRPHLALHSCGCGGAAPARRPPRRCGRTWRCTGDTRHVPLSHTLSAAAAPGAAQVTRDTCPSHTHSQLRPHLALHSCGCGGAAPARCPPRRCGRTWRCTGDTRHVPSHTHSQLRLRRRGARALPAAPLRPHLALHRYEPRPPRPPQPPAPAPPSPAPSSSDDSEALSPPASPTLHLDTARLYPPKPAAARARRHSVCGGSPRATRPPLAVDRFWQELQQQRWVHGGSPEPDDFTLLSTCLQAVSCSTGLQLSPRPRTCPAVPRPRVNERPNPGPGPAPDPAPAFAPAPAHSRGKLDKSHSTPAYDFEPSEPGVLTSQTIPESPTTPTAPATPPHCPWKEKAGQILDFKKSSSQIEEAIQLRSRRGHADDDKVDIFSDEDVRPIDEDSKLEIVETVNVVLSESFKVTERTTVEEVKRVMKVERKSSPKYSADDTSSDDQIPIPVKYPKPRITERYRPADIPPEPPPRPYILTRDPPIPPPRDSISREARGHVTPREVSPPAARVVPRELSPAAQATPRAPPRDARPPAPAGPPAHVRDVLWARAGDNAQAPSRPLSKRDIQLVAAPRRELPALSGAERPEGGAGAGAGAPGDAAGARAVLPKRGLKKKNSMLAKRRGVAARALAAGGAAGGAWQRVRTRGGAARWAARHLLLAHSLLYAFRSADAPRAACMIYLEGCTASAAPEVKSRPHAFKVYHTGTAFYFACESQEATQAWIQLIHRATLLPSLLSEMELSKQFSETDYSDTESDNESTERRNEKDRQIEKEREKEKSKFGSLKKLTHRSGRSESQENVNQATATSLDRKYLRFFSRARPKDEAKNVKSKPVGAPVPTEHYRSYRREVSNPIKPSKPTKPTKPTPINYIHASNPNLLDFEKSDFVTKPAIQIPKPPAAEKPVGFVTLEQFMLQKQAEERRGGERRRARVGDRGRGEGLGYELEESAPRSERRPPGRHAQAESPQTPPTQTPTESGAGGVSRLRLMFGSNRSEPSAQYPHLQCPPTFQPETYSLSRPPRPRD